MRTAERTVDRTLTRDVGAIGLAVFAVGMSFGAIAVAAGLPGWAVIAMSIVVFAGGSQFMAVGLVAAGNPFAAVFAGLLLNARHLPFGLAVADAVGTGWRRRLIGSHILIDESVAFTMAQSDPASRRRAYWLTGGTLFVSWNVGGVLGVLLGEAVGDTDALGLDAAFPAGLIALLLPSLRDRETRSVALAGALVAVVTTPLLPAGLPVLLALSGLLLMRRRPPGARGIRAEERGGSPVDGAPLGGAPLPEAPLGGARLGGAPPGGAPLDGARLGGAPLGGAPSERSEHGTGGPAC